MFGHNLFTSGPEAIKVKLSKIIGETFDFSFTLRMNHYLYVCEYSKDSIDKQLEKEIKDFLSSHKKYAFNGELLAACCLRKSLSSGSHTTHVTYILSPYILLLFQMGAGICCNLDHYIENLCSIRPQLFIGASWEFQHHQHGLGNHISHSSDIIRLVKQNKLSIDDLNHLEEQAKHALEFGCFDKNIQAELTNVINLIHFATRFWMMLTEKQKNAYIKHNPEIVVTSLQGHQFFAAGMPAEMLYGILDNILELNYSEIDDLREKLINYHCEAFPEARARIEM